MLSLIWAMDRNRLIGKGNSLPWHIPADLEYFRKTTEGKAVIMGLNTFRSIGKPLPRRRNIVLNYSKINIDGVEIVTSVEEALELVKGQDAFVIGGKSVYGQFLKYADMLYITYIDYAFEGDVYFPEFDITQYELIKETKGIKDQRNPYDYWFRIYKKKI